MNETTINIYELFKEGCVRYFTRLNDIFSQYDSYDADPYKYFFEYIYRDYCAESAYREYLPLITENTLEKIDTMDCTNTIVLPLFGIFDNLFCVVIDRLTNPDFYERKDAVSSTISNNEIEMEILDICNAIMKIYDVPDKLKWFISYFKNSIVIKHTTYCFSLYEKKYKNSDKNAFSALSGQDTLNPYALDYSHCGFPNLKEFPITFQESKNFIYTFVSSGRLKNFIKNKNLKPDDVFNPVYGYFTNIFKKMINNVN